MFNKIFILLLLLTSNFLLAQGIPNQFNYQMSIRNSDGTISQRKNLNVDILLLEGSQNGSIKFIESHQVQSNDFGIVNLIIGSKNGNELALLDFNVNQYFIQVKADGQIISTSPLNSVPYALSSKTANTISTKGTSNGQILMWNGTEWVAGN